jgi:hypothetical protein
MQLVPLQRGGLAHVHGHSHHRLSGGSGNHSRPGSRKGFVGGAGGGGGSVQVHFS